MISRPIINAGVPGDTTVRAMTRLEQDVLSKSPRMVLITLGGNDLKNRTSKESAYQNLKNIIVSIQLSFLQRRRHPLHGPSDIFITVEGAKTNKPPAASAEALAGCADHARPG
jgi:lysophospholipase L1-like esterase